MRHIYADFIDKLAKPTRYLGGEYMSVQKDPAAIAGRAVLAFPDVYEIGMSHMGTKILYSAINRAEDLWCERAFCPWVDLEAELRKRELPLVSLESQTPLEDFDLIGISLQYELSYSNVLTMLDLGGIPLLSAERSASDAYVIGGGPCATHPEPVADFFDAFFIGEAEDEFEGLVRAVAQGRRAGRPRRELLVELSQQFSIYVPSLYELATDEDTGALVVGAPTEKGVPARVSRAMPANLDDHPFPSDFPVPYAEAIFDRAGVEIARGCTEGCRFCQAGMIYRPVRERTPESIVDSIVDGVNKAGYDETSLTCLSTADYSSITPLVKKVMGEIKHRRVSLSVSSLRAYGLGEEILDEMAQMRISGLTFAPEAGTQRMRDVVNKNITQEHIEESARRVFGRGWHRLKLYFMIGLPTEEDVDVQGIADTGKAMLQIGRTECGRRSEVTVSVSTHVPKPHTPFQWCAQDSIEETKRKHELLRGQLRERGLKLKTHDRGVSWVEGVFSRGDRRLCKSILEAWKRGARFDGWTECFDLNSWREVFAETGVDTDALLGTRPVTARLPWDHIDVGLEDGFLLSEYRKSVRSRLSPPCGKVRGHLVHHSNLKEAEAERGKLVCYDCGVACDLSKMKEDRLVSLRSLGAVEPALPSPKVIRAIKEKKGNNQPAPRQEDQGLVTRRIRMRYAKLGRLSYLGHLDTMRVLARLFRRADVEVAYTKGFSPKPHMQFAPALPLGVASLGEIADVVIVSEKSADEILERLKEVSPEGMYFTGVWELPSQTKGLGKVIEGYDLIAASATALGADELTTRVSAFLAKDSHLVTRKKKSIDVRSFVESMEVLDENSSRRLSALFDWGEERSLIRMKVRLTPEGSAKPIELCRALQIAGDEGDLRAPGPKLARLGFSGEYFREHGSELSPEGSLAILQRDPRMDISSPATLA